MKPEDNTPAPVTRQRDDDSLFLRLWLVAFALLAVGALFATGVLVVSPSGPSPVSVSRDRALTHPRVDQTENVQTVEPPSTPLDSAGGPDRVWVDTRSKVYHFLGTRWYGHTHHGKFASKADAIAEGDRAAKNERQSDQIEAAKQ